MANIYPVNVRIKYFLDFMSIANISPNLLILIAILMLLVFFITLTRKKMIMKRQLQTSSRVVRFPATLLGRATPLMQPGIYEDNRI